MASLTSLYDEMNKFLADQIVLGMKIHNFHWYIKGDAFFPVHPELDNFYDDAQKRIDEVAERILAVGAKPIGNLKEVVETSTVEELDDEWMSAVEGFNALIVDFEHLNQLAKHIIKLAEELDDYGTADYFTSTSLELEKNLWMFKSYTR